jgi:hypothetical protein
MIRIDPIKAHAKLKSLLASRRRNERACREYLPLANELLSKYESNEFKGHVTELPGRFGPSDYMVRCTCMNVAGQKEDHVYIWEVKAPQCPLFVRETKMRARPSPDLIKAENQLLHYYADQSGSNSFLQDLQIPPGHVHLGGIIIGTRWNLMKGELSSQAKTSAARAFELRRKLIYDPANIEVYTWERILDYLINKPPIKKSVKNTRLPKGLNTSPDRIAIQHVGPLSKGGTDKAMARKILSSTRTLRKLH